MRSGGSSPVGEGQEDGADAALLLSTTELGNDEKALCDHVGDANAAEGDNAAEQAENQCLQGKTLHLILRYRDEGGGSGRKSKRLTTEEKEERQRAEDSLMAALTDIANVPDSYQPEDAPEQGAKNRTRRRRREERGFRGTFLHGMSSPSNAEEGTISPKDFSVVTTDCIVLDDSPGKEQPHPSTASTRAPTTSTVATDDPLAKHLPTPPLQDVSDDVIVIDDDNEDSSKPRKEEEPIVEIREEPRNEGLPPEHQSGGAPVVDQRTSQQYERRASFLSDDEEKTYDPKSKL